MSRLKLAWTILKGWVCPGTTAFLEIAKLALGTVNSALSPAAGKIAKACETISSALQVLDRYADWCPGKWRTDFDRIRALVAQIVGVLEDGAISENELEKVSDLFRIEYARWFAD